jgi:hypothetical protein
MTLIMFEDAGYGMSGFPGFRRNQEAISQAKEARAAILLDHTRKPLPGAGQMG